MMKKLVERIRKNPEKLDPIALSAAAHLDFESIHPFRDGNGRVGRLLSNWILMRSGYPPIIIENREKRRYFSALEAGQARDDVSRIRFFFVRKMMGALDFYLERFARRVVVPKKQMKK
jgi:Fic family protein